MDYERELRIPYSKITREPCRSIEDALYHNVSEGLYYRIHKHISFYIITPYSTKDVDCYELSSYIMDNVNIDFSLAFRYNGNVYNITGQAIPYPSRQELILIFNISR